MAVRKCLPRYPPCLILSLRVALVTSLAYQSHPYSNSYKINFRDYLIDGKVTVSLPEAPRSPGSLSGIYRWHHNPIHCQLEGKVQDISELATVVDIMVMGKIAPDILIFFFGGETIRTCDCW